jgi:hypothetical protein
VTWASLSERERERKTEDLTFYFYDRTGLNLSLFDLVKLRQYKQDVKVYGGLVGNTLDVLSSQEAKANTQANML